MTMIPEPEEVKAKMMVEWDQIQGMAVWEWYKTWVEEERAAILRRFRDNIPGGGEKFEAWSLDWWHRHGELRGIERVQAIPEKITKYFVDLSEGAKEGK
jgi:hypothetical protein